MEKQESIHELFKRYLLGTYSRADLEQLLNHFNIGEDKEILMHLIAAEMDRNPDGGDIETIKEIGDRLEVKIFNKTRPTKKLHRLWPWVAAACVIAVIFLSIFLFRSKVSSVQQIANHNIEVYPGGNNAELTLSNGKKVDLKHLPDGTITDQSGITITKSSDGQIIYSASENTIIGTIAYNTITTPRGGEYRVSLPDGSRVWLNAASSLKYPSSFGAQKERRVELSGEAYFEVAHDKRKPFRVLTNGQVVEVLGTHFNISSYTDDAGTVTTLEQGSVKVTVAADRKILQPGQQAVHSGQELRVSQADLHTALAWKNGKIYFKDADIQSIMKQVSRWYDIDVAFEGNPSVRVFNGGISRKANLSALLQILELNKIRFRMEKEGMRTKLTVIN